MCKKIGTIFILLGVICILGAIGFHLYNGWEAKKASQSTQSLLEDIKSVIDQDENDETAEDMAGNAQVAMDTLKVEEYECIGILSIPALDLDLPVLADWSYAKLKKAPCLYYGSCHEKDFVIAAHNYKAHFGRLSELQSGDIVTFTDVKGEIFYYEVELLETLPKDATKEMITSGFDLSLYTCTTGGGSRVTVRCRSIQENSASFPLIPTL